MSREYIMSLEEDEEKKYRNKRKYAILGYILLFVVIVIIMFKYMNYNKELNSSVYEVKRETYEISAETICYVVKEETVVDYDKSKDIVPIADENKRIRIGSTIAIYKTPEYSNKLAELDKIDLEINEKLNQIGEIYSNELNSINSQIDNVLNNMNNTSSYISIASYKNRLDELSSEKAAIRAKLSNNPEISNLLKKREEYKNEIKSYEGSITADISGLVVYNVDNYEGKYKINENNITAEYLEEIINDYSSNTNNTFGIKLIDNNNVYIIVKDKEENKKYLSIGKSYRIELFETNETTKGVLVAEVSKNGNNYSVYKISTYMNGLLNGRKADVKVVLKSVEGFVVNNTSLEEENGIKYVTILSLNEYVKIPVKVLLTLDEVSYVDNYTNEEKEKLNINSNNTLCLYDMVVKGQ